MTSRHQKALPPQTTRANENGAATSVRATASASPGRRAVSALSASVMYTFTAGRAEAVAAFGMFGCGGGAGCDFQSPACTSPPRARWPRQYIAMAGTRSRPTGSRQWSHDASVVSRAGAFGPVPLRDAQVPLDHGPPTATSARPEPATRLSRTILSRAVQ